MKSLRWSILMVAWLPALFVCGVGNAQIADYLYWGVITQNRVYPTPGTIDPDYVFLLEIETAMNVDYVEFMTATGKVYTIPNDAETVSGNIETYHELWDDFDVWGYWGYFSTAAGLADYGDGWYTITLHYTDGASEQTDVWYGEPEADYAIAQPVQKPYLTSPVYLGAEASPVTFTWDECIDPNVYDIYLAVTDANGQDVVDDILEPTAISSGPHSLDEGWHEVELIFEDFWPIYNIDNIPFDLIKASVALHEFEVIYNSVYRFWSPVTDRHFYTASAGEKDKLISNYSHVWTYEGVAFHACVTDYFVGLLPVYRFWSAAASSHFYTISESEKDKLVNQYSDVWTYEGPAFYAYPQGSPPAGTRAVYRFYKPIDNTHFYTISESEKTKLINEFSHVYVYEGIAYYSYE